MSVTAAQNNIDPILTGRDHPTAGGSGETAALRQAAEQFEAILLMQLTSVLSSSGSDQEGLLFGRDGGSDLAQKMFSEHLATAMAEAGGIGLADTILRQFGVAPDPAAAKNPLAGAAAVFRELRYEKNPAGADSASLINRSAVIEPVASAAAGSGGPGPAEIISVAGGEDYRQEEWRQPFYRTGEKSARIDPGGGDPPVAAGFSNVNGTAAAGGAGFQMPVAGRISSKFGNRFHPIDRRMKFHGGIDIKAPRGAQISAAADGIVKFAGRRGGYGNLVIIEHPDGRQTRYAHAEKLLVSKGDKVLAGEPIATVGSTGKATGPHLHFEMRENGRPIDPADVLSNVLRKTADR